MLLWTYTTGDTVLHYKDSIVIFFKDDRNVLSTSHLNGGYREDIKYIFNHDINSGMGLKCEITSAVYENHMKLLATELGLQPDVSAGLLTAASMDNVSIQTESFDDLTVTAIVTGGVEINGGRVGDPAFFHERQGETVAVQEGTINILLYIDADLPEETMTRALVTCTEAKTAALQELLAGSNYSRGLATGSGTDGTVIICNSKAKSRLIYAGKHSKLGELIGLTVKQAVKEALFLQTGLCPEYQFSMLNRLRRFGINEISIWEQYRNSSSPVLERQEFLTRLTSLEREETLVIPTILYAHLMDQLDWQLLSPEQAVAEGKNIIERLKDKYFLQDEFYITHSSIDSTITEMTACFAALTAKIIEHTTRS